jgi:hypothetical protein
MVEHPQAAQHQLKVQDGRAGCLRCSLIGSATAGTCELIRAWFFEYPYSAA